MSLAHISQALFKFVIGVGYNLGMYIIASFNTHTVPASGVGITGGGPKPKLEFTKSSMLSKNKETKFVTL